MPGSAGTRRWPRRWTCCWAGKRKRSGPAGHIQGTRFPGQRTAPSPPQAGLGALETQSRSRSTLPCTGWGHPGWLSTPHPCSHRVPRIHQVPVCTRMQWPSPMTTLRALHSVSSSQTDERTPGESDPPGPQWAEAKPLTLEPRLSLYPAAPSALHGGSGAGQATAGLMPARAVRAPVRALTRGAARAGPRAPSPGSQPEKDPNHGHERVFWPFDGGHTSSLWGAWPTVSLQRTGLWLSLSLTWPPSYSVVELGHLSGHQGHPGTLLRLLSPTQGTRVSRVQSIIQAQGSSLGFTYLFHP